MFARYALPSDDLAGTATSVSASAEDAEYPATNLIAPSATGHLNLPSRPAKLTTPSGAWTLTFDSPIAVVAAALIYHNFDAGLDVTLEAGGFSQAIPIPAKPGAGDDWTLSPWITFGPETHDAWTLHRQRDQQPARPGRAPVAARRVAADRERRPLGRRSAGGAVDHRAGDRVRRRDDHRHVQRAAAAHGRVRLPRHRSVRTPRYGARRGSACCRGS